MELRVVFYEFAIRVSEKRLLMPLMMIKGIDNFTVELPWLRSDTLDPLDDEQVLPFDLRRPIPGKETRWGVATPRRRGVALWMHKLGRWLTYPYRAFQ